MAKFRYKTFKLLSYATSFALALFVTLGCVCAILCLTLDNDGFLNNYFTKSKTITAVYSELMTDYQQLSKETDIPSDVFSNAVGWDFVVSVQPSVIESTKSTNTLDFQSTTDLKEKYSNAIQNYVESENLELTQDQQQIICQKAINCFNNNCAITNTKDLAYFANLLSSRAMTVAIGSAIGFVACIFLIRFLNERRKKSFNYVAMSLVIAGELMITLPAIALILKVVDSLELTNIFGYNLAINSAVNTTLILIIAVGIVAFACGVITFSTIYTHYRRKLLESDTEAQIAKELIR